MAIATTVRRFLAANGISFQEQIHRRTETLEASASVCDIPPEQMARAVLVADAGQLWMAILPVSHVLDFDVLNRLTHRQLKPLSNSESNRRFPDCEPGCHPPVPEAYGLKALVDDSLFKHERIWLEAGAHTAVIAISISSFAVLCRKAIRGPIAKPLPESESSAGCAIDESDLKDVTLPSEEVIRRKLEQVYRLPAIPAVATQILQLVGDPESTVKDLAELVEMDPSIAAQVIRYARSSFFGYRGSVDSIQTAISRVLGFDIVSNLALGIAAGKVFKLAPDGPLGLDSFWRHAVHNAAVVQGLTRVLPKNSGVKPGTAYLCGLLHNFGILLLGHLFQPEYFLLNKMCLANPHCGLPAIEQRLLCVGESQRLLNHNQMGTWLMRHWKMPEEVVAVTAGHHDPVYRGEQDLYVALVQLANALLARDGLGDDLTTPIADWTLQRLGISLAAAEQVYDQIRADSAELDRMAQLMAGLK